MQPRRRADERLAIDADNLSMAIQRRLWRRRSQSEVAIGRVRVARRKGRARGVESLLQCSRSFLFIYIMSSSS